MPASQHEAIVRWLKSPEAYPHRPSAIQHVETHISDVFLADSYAYKLKKPVQYDFLDYTTLSARERACHEELRLNRRLAPDAYLGVVPIAASNGDGFLLGGSGPVVDWLVHMRRLPTELTLDALHRRGELTRQHIDRLAATLVHFYQSLSPVKFAPVQYLERCLAHVQGNAQELRGVQHHLPPGVVQRVHGFQLQLLALRPALFEQRAADGRIVDGHGDLRPEHICLGEPIQIFDCIEFSADLRRIDVADELAFLAAECDFLGADWVGPQLLAAYQQSGGQPPPILFDFYKSYRACVRAKVAALRADQLAGDAQQAAAAEARQHLTWADKYTAAWLRPLVVVVGGLSGSGKTTLAAALAKSLGAELLRTDVMRTELRGASNSTSNDYTDEARHRVYQEMLQRASALHGERISVILDGTFSFAEHLQQARALTADSRSLFLAIECICDAQTARERIERRLAAHADASEADSHVYEMQRQNRQLWPTDLPSIQIDTEQPLKTQLEQAIAKLAVLAAE